MINNVNNPFGNRAISSSTSSDSNGRRQKEDPKEELKKYIEDEGIDLEGDITDELEVFKLPDGRFLYVEA